jgi:NAD(P)H-hydrate epimerase
MSDDAISKIAALLQQVGEVHHTVFADTEGADDDWATFYSDWLLHHSDFSKLLGRTPVRSHLTRDLVELDERYTKERHAEAWPQWYASQLLDR